MVKKWSKMVKKARFAIYLMGQAGTCTHAGAEPNARPIHAKMAKLTMARFARHCPCARRRGTVCGFKSEMQQQCSGPVLFVNAGE